MADHTEIAWADSTFNPWIGCTKVGPGCDNCYAEQLDKSRFSRTLSPMGTHWGPGAPRHRTSESNWKKPLAWNREAEASGVRRRVFCASLADVFDNEVPVEWRMDLFDLIWRTPALTWLLLTKRIGNAEDMLPGGWYAGGEAPNGPFPTVWIGATIVNQEEADRDIPKLLQVPAAVRWLSIEPQQGPIDLGPFLDRGATADNGMREFDAVDWVICGGESGTKARPFDLAWARSLRDQCAAVGVPFFMKQLGAFAIECKTGAGKAEFFALRPRDRAGADPAEWPEDLRVRQFPQPT